MNLWQFGAVFMPFQNSQRFVKEGVITPILQKRYDKFKKIDKAQNFENEKTTTTILHDTFQNYCLEITLLQSSSVWALEVLLYEGRLNDIIGLIPIY